MTNPDPTNPGRHPYRRPRLLEGAAAVAGAAALALKGIALFAVALTGIALVGSAVMGIAGEIPSAFPAFLTFSAFSGVASAASPGTAASGVEAPQPAHGGRLVVATSTDPDSLDPHKALAVDTEQILFNVYESLLTVDPQGEIRPALATRWEVSPDGLEYTFWLRPGVKFHDGRPLRAEDVRYSLQRVMDPATGNKARSDWTVVERIEVPAPDRVRIRLRRPFAPFLTAVAVVTAAIVPEGSGDQLNVAPVGTGPFRFVEWVPASHVTLRRFDGYWKPDLPYLDEVVFRVLPDPTAALLALKAGDVDVVLRLSGEVAQELERGADTKVVSGPQNLVQVMAINNARPPFNDLRVRQAIEYAIDRRELLEGVAWGYGTLIGSNMTPVSPYYVDLTGLYPYDPAKARSLLAEAGYPTGFTATLALPEPYDFHQRTGELIAAQLERVGIRLRLEIVEWARWLSDIYQGRNYDLTIIGFSGKPDPHDALRRYYSGYPNNFLNFKDPEYDRLIDEGTATADPERRKAIYAQAQRILAEKAAAVFIMDPHQIVGLRKDVYGWQLYPLYVADVARVYRGSRN